MIVTELSRHCSIDYRPLALSFHSAVPGEISRDGENCWRGRWILFVSRNDRVARLLEQFSLFTSIVPRASGEKEKRRIPDDPSGHRGRAKVVYLERNSRPFVNFANKEPRSRTRIMAGRCMSFPSLTMLLGQYRCHFARANSIDSELSPATVLLGARARGTLRGYYHFTRRSWCGLLKFNLKAIILGQLISSCGIFYRNLHQYFRHTFEFYAKT